jgi:hypothetical protein
VKRDGIVRALVVAAAASAVVLVSQFGVSTSQAQPAAAPAELANPASPVLRDLRSVDELRSAFNRDAGKVRLVLLLSPT